MALDQTEKTNDIKDVNAKYALAKRIAWTFYLSHQHTYLDHEDYVQDIMLGLLEGRLPKYALLDSFIKAAPLSKLDKGPIPSFVPTDYEDIPCDNGIEEQVEVNKILELIDVLPDDEREVLLRYYGNDETDVEIGKSKSLTKARIGQIRHKALQTIRGRIK